MNKKLLSESQHRVDFELGDTIARYELKGSLVEFSLLPKALREGAVPRRKSGRVHPQLSVMKLRESTNGSVDPFVHIAVRGETAHGGLSTGATMRNNAATKSLVFGKQLYTEVGVTQQIDTWLSSPLGFVVKHRLLWDEGDLGVRVITEVENTGTEALPVEMLTSFSLSGITPFVEDDASNRLRLHRFRSAWSNEGNHDVASLETLSLERAWVGLTTSFRYGQTGSLPVRNFHPFIALEDEVEGVFWGAQIAWHGSWQMEVYRQDDPVSISGGLGDYERAHWMKEIAPGETFTAPTALVACGQGDLDDFCNRLVQVQQRLNHAELAHEAELPIIFNEWCSTWGNPTHDYLVKTADKLAETPTKYLVIDDGWAEKPEGRSIQYNGDWNVDAKAFPGGLSKTTAAIRERGLIPGIWFEFECCTEGTEAFEKNAHQLHRHGKVLQVGNRHFWDFRDPWTFEYLTGKVIALLRDNNIGYLKVDYNESIGLGCDGAESLGEGLRQHLAKVKEFFKKIREEVPGIVIENCSSGGSRLEPGMVGLTSLSSSTDAHETVEIPIIGAHLHRLIPASKNQLWAVLRPDDTLQRIRYSLSATFLGRMCISGDLVDLTAERFEVLKEAQAFYVKAAAILRDGRSRLIDCTGASRRYPTGWQALVRQSNDGNSLLVVVHTFDLEATDAGILIELPGTSQWTRSMDFNAPKGSHIDGGRLILPLKESFYGSAFILKQGQG